MSLSIHELDPQAVRLFNDELTVTVLPGEGSNILSVLHNKTNTEILRAPDSKEQFESMRLLYGTPVLFPPNRIEDGTFQFDGRTYELDITDPSQHVHLHGWLYNKPWTIKEQTDTTLITEFQSQNDPDMVRQFPHHCTFTMTITLDGNELHQDITIQNNSDTKMPLGFGYHTMFHFPAGQATLALDVATNWILTDRNLPTGQLQQDPLASNWQQGLDVTGHQLDHVYPVQQNRTARIKRTDVPLTIDYQIGAGFTQWVIFTEQGDKQFVAVEPYTWVTNAPNLNLPADQTGIQTLSQNETTTLSTKITIN